MSLAEFPSATEEALFRETPQRPDVPLEEYTVVELIDAFRSTKEQHYFGMLTARYQVVVDRYLLGKGVVNDAERQDLVQEIFMQAFQKIHQLREPACFGGWLKSMARRMSINKATRKERRYRHVSLHSGSPEDGDFLLEDLNAKPADILTISEETCAKVRRAMNMMKPLDAKMLRQFYFNGWSLEEVAARNKKPIGTIKRRLHTARGRLGILMSHYMDVPSDQRGLGIDA